MFVVDASTTLAWCLRDDDSAAADGFLARLADEEAAAPSIWTLEVANGLRSAERRGRLTAADLPRLRRLLTALPVRVELTELPEAIGEVLDTARAFSLSAYDAAYLVLALRRGLPLATIDRGLVVAAERAGVDLL